MNCVVCFQDECECKPRTVNEKEAKFKTNDKKQVLCGICNKPVHIDDFAGIDQKGIFHKACSIFSFVRLT